MRSNGAIDRKEGQDMAAAKVRKMEIGRDTRTGQFLPIKVAKRRKATATIEMIKFKNTK